MFHQKELLNLSHCTMTMAASDKNTFTYGRQHNKTCLRGVPTSKAQTSLHVRADLFCFLEVSLPKLATGGISNF